MTNYVIKNKSKTEMCETWGLYGFCVFGRKCMYAHGLDDLRTLDQPPRYKSEACRNYNSADGCPYGKRCMYKHSFRLPIFQKICTSE